MKSKRQTVWLVSMLSLMVVLSAYYLFTEDSGSPTPPSADGAQVTTMNDGSASGSDVVLNEVLTGTDKESLTTDNSNEVVTEGAVNPEVTDKDSTVQSEDNSKPQQVTTDNKTAAKDPTDEDVLKQLASGGVSAADSLTAYQLERNEKNVKKSDELIQAISDEKKTLEESAMAQKQLGALEEKEAKIINIEERLQQQYANAVVTEDNNQYKVVVVSEKLGAKEAVGIVDLVIKELGVSQDKVSVQYVTQ